MTSTTTLSLHKSLDDGIDAAQWDQLVHHHPFMTYGFLQALHHTGCASPRTGWTPLCLTLTRDDQLCGAVMLYLKRHSRGEFVFDQAWANAYAQHGLAYYPKLLGAVPFTPVPGPRLLAHSHEDRVTLARGAIALARQNELSSLHFLFPDEDSKRALIEAGYLLREDVQFHWHNAGYASVEAFLATLSREKRKKVLQDRKRVRAAGVTFEWRTGAQITPDDLDFFYGCYEVTYLEHGNAPYLSREAFAQIHAALPDAIVLIVATQATERVAAALCITGPGALYGRYWGATRFISGLHFETCYLQSIEYCITHGIARFEGGAQGEHKMARGLLPVRTFSCHWVGDMQFADAIGNYLDRERAAVEEYRSALEAHTPFKRPDGAG